MKTVGIRQAAAAKFMDIPALIYHLSLSPVRKTVNDSGTFGRRRLFYQKPYSGKGKWWGV